MYGTTKKTVHAIAFGCEAHCGPRDSQKDDSAAGAKKLSPAAADAMRLRSAGLTAVPKRGLAVGTPALPECPVHVGSVMAAPCINRLTRIQSASASVKGQ